MGQTAAEALPADQVKASKANLDAGGPLFNYAAKGNTVTFAGKENVNGKDAFKLKLKTKDSVESVFFIDPATWYILKSIAKTSVAGNEVETTIVFSNYKKTDYGYVMPTNTEINMSQGLVLNITSKKTEINKEMDTEVIRNAEVITLTFPEHKVMKSRRRRCSCNTGAVLFSGTPYKRATLQFSLPVTVVFLI